MPAELPKPDPIVITAYLDDVEGELDAAARLMAEPVSRFAAFHLQQAAEKLVKAVRLHRSLPATADHNVAALIDGLPPADAWRAKLSPLAPLSAYATAYRYPSPGGKRKPGPAASELRDWIDRIRPLVSEARSSL
jgi:hypothetical protein